MRNNQQSLMLQGRAWLLQAAQHAKVGRSLDAYTAAHNAAEYFLQADKITKQEERRLEWEALNQG